MKKEEYKDNSFGVAGVILGILSIIFVGSPFAGIAVGILAIIFSIKQKKHHANKWSKAAKILGIIGIILSIIVFAAGAYYISTNPDLLSQFKSGYSAP
ncbi:hypothetical protein KW787_02255 [Candidatus Pacearchaeota archaeon]|nr:hypothetical protein [Candidatus Pacearchaeota archaeon]